MILWPDEVIAAMRERAERDLALVALVAGMCDSEEEAVERLEELATVTADHLKTLGRSDHTQKAIARGVVEMAPRLATAIRQVVATGEAKIRP